MYVLWFSESFDSFHAHTSGHPRDFPQGPETRTCCPSLEETSPRDQAQTKERPTWRSIAGWRALYDQMASQLCLFTFRPSSTFVRPGKIWLYDPRTLGCAELLVFRPSDPRMRRSFGCSTLGPSDAPNFVFSTLGPSDAPNFRFFDPGTLGCPNFLNF